MTLAPRVRFVGALALLAAVPLALASRFDLDPFDSAELALAAVTRGLAHPPGQPLHTLIGWLLTRLPGPPLTWLAWLSIAPGALLFALMATREQRVSRPVMLAAAAGVLVAVSLPGVRDVCARVEVYALAALFVAGAVSVRSDLVAGVLWGCAGAVNPVIAAQGALAMGLARYKRAGHVIAGVIIGLLPLGYAWAVHGREGVTLVWGAPHDAHSFWRWITAADFQRNVSVSLGTWFAHFAQLTWDQTRTGVVPWMLVGWAGLVHAGERRHVAGAVFASCVGGAMIAANGQYLGRNPDYPGYLLVPIALALPGVVHVVAMGTARAMRVGVTVTVGVAALAVMGSLGSRPVGLARDMATEALRSTPPGGILVLESDHLLFPALYLQEVESVRHDVLVVNPGWASSAWAWHWSERRDPTIHADLTPGLGGVARLARALAGRAPGRAVLGDSLTMLRNVVVGGVCPRGVGWSSDEACAEGRAWRVRMRGQLASWARRARGRTWDGAAVWTLAEELGDGANALGCTGLAAQFYRAGLGDTEERVGRLCDGRSVPLPPREGFLTIDAPTLRARLARVEP